MPSASMTALVMVVTVTNWPCPWSLMPLTSQPSGPHTPLSRFIPNQPEIMLQTARHMVTSGMVMLALRRRVRLLASWIWIVLRVAS